MLQAGLAMGDTWLQCCAVTVVPDVAVMFSEAEDSLEARDSDWEAMIEVVWLAWIPFGTFSPKACTISVTVIASGSTCRAILFALVV